VRHESLSFKTLLLMGALVLIVAPIAYCSLVQVRVVVVNDGPSRLEDVTVTVSNVADHLGALAPAAKSSCWVRASGESGVTVRYRTAQGKRVDSGSVGYLEPGYSGTITFVVNDEGVQRADWRVRVLP
jgi:hypothetical protein